MKKLAIIIASASFIALGVMPAANAQLFPYTGTSTAPSSSVINAGSSTATSTASSGVAASSSAMTSSPASTPAVTAEPVIVMPGTNAAGGPIGQYLQIDGLTIAGASAATATDQPVTISAANPAYQTMTAAGELMPVNSAATVTCTQFASDSSPTGISAACPTPPMAMTSATGTSGTDHAPYSIIINAATELLLGDRSPATLAELTPGATINVYGYYTNDGSMEAEIVRDVSRSASGTTTMTTLEAELNQLEALAVQLEAEVTGIGSSTISATTGTVATATVAPTLGTGLYCPMIAASGETNTAVCPPASTTTSASSGTPIIYQ